MAEQRFFKHLKSGKYYIVINDNVIIEETMERAVAYTRLQPDPKEPLTLAVWIRPYKEFKEKFKLVTLKE